MQGKSSFAVLLVLLGVMIHLPYGRMQRSPYVPMPVNLPGLLPRFGEDNSAATGQAAASSSSSGTSGDSDFVVPSRGAGDVSGRIGEEADVPVERPTRPVPSRAPVGCPPQQVPCYDCMVYISRTGQITKYTADGRRL